MIPLRVDILRTRAAIVNVLLILINVLAFLDELRLSPKMGRALVYTFGLIPAHEQMLFARHGIAARASHRADVQQHVSARGMDAPVGQHALSLGFWGRGGRSSGTLSIPHLLLDLRRRLGGGAHNLQPGLEGSHDWRERSDFRSYGCLYRFVSTGAGDHPDSRHCFCFSR